MVWTDRSILPSLPWWLMMYVMAGSLAEGESDFSPLSPLLFTPRY
jgi:hypothetical protein